MSAAASLAKADGWRTSPTPGPPRRRPPPRSPLDPPVGRGASGPGLRSCSSGPAWPRRTYRPRRGRGPPSPGTTAGPHPTARRPTSGGRRPLRRRSGPCTWLRTRTPSSRRPPGRRAADRGHSRVPGRTSRRSPPRPTRPTAPGNAVLRQVQHAALARPRGTRTTRNSFASRLAKNRTTSAVISGSDFPAAGDREPGHERLELPVGDQIGFRRARMIRSVEGSAPFSMAGGRCSGFEVPSSERRQVLRDLLRRTCHPVRDPGALPDRSARIGPAPGSSLSP